MGNISSDPSTIPEKAKVGFSWREFGYIAAEQYCRLNYLQEDDGIGVRGDMEADFGMWHAHDSQAGPGFVAGWTAYMREHKRGPVWLYATENR